MKRFVWSTAIFFTIVLTAISCGPTPTTTPTITTNPVPVPSPMPSSTPVPTPNSTSAIEKPKYGGVLNMSSTGTAADDNWNPFGPSSNIVQTMYESLLYGNWYLTEKEHPGNYIDFTVDQVVGWLAESWEQADAQTFVFHLRKGIRWQNKPPVNGRELNADDVKWSYEQCLAAPLSNKGILPIIDKITTKDKYTVVFHTAQPRTIEFLTEAFQGSSSIGGLVVPREVIDTYGQNALVDWRKAIGTGPWIATDALAGSANTFVRNPDYWDYDKNWPENKLPYMDGMRIIIIKDTSTLVAAQRTGKVDLLKTADIDEDQLASMLKSSPWLKYRELKPIGSVRVHMNCAKAPFTDIRVRQAMNMAVDYQQIIKDMHGGRALIPYEIVPFPPHWPEFIKPEEYPQVVRDMFSHNVAKAKQLLAEAGYPNGFKTEAIMASTHVDMMSLIKTYLADIGVDMALKVVEPAAKDSIMRTRTYPQMVVYGVSGAGSGVASPSSCIARYFTIKGGADHSGYDDPWINETIDRAQQIQDKAERLKLYKEMGVKIMVDAPILQLPPSSSYTVWEPWVKGGYWGQYGMIWGDRNMQKHFWLDMDLKQSIIAGK